MSAGHFATPRVAAGVVIVRDHSVLMVRPTYKEFWDIPGGYVEPGESPEAACKREIKEELDLSANTLQLAAIDWAPNEKEGDKLLFLFLAPHLTDIDPASLRFPDQELTEARFIDLDELAQFTIPRLVRRLTTTAAAVESGQFPVYLEHGDAPRANSAR